MIGLVSYNSMGPLIFWFWIAFWTYKLGPTKYRSATFGAIWMIGWLWIG